MNLKEFEKEVKKCDKCGLSDDRINVVPGEGSEKAEIMFIGEGPGRNEDEQGRPFVGAAGKFLTELIELIGLTRKEVYIANVVKCRPPENRDPMPEEVEACWPWLESQIKIIQPKLIVPLGRHSLARFLPSAKISADHGRALRKNFENVGRVIFFPCYHPAAALYNGNLRDVLKKDFAKIPKILELMKKDEQSLDNTSDNKSNPASKKEAEQGSLL